MNKILLIIKREYLSRVKKKSFIIMTILGPLLMAGIMIVPIWLSMQKSDQQKIEVIDESTLFIDLIPQKDFIRFDYPPVSFEDAEKGFYDTDYDAILYIPRNILSGGNAIKILYKKQLSVGVEQYIVGTISKMMYDVILAKNKVDLNIIKDAEVNSQFKLITEKVEEDGNVKKTNTGLYMAIGLGAGILIYMFIFLYGVQVMRGVMEEKTNRIVEVILSSVKPFQLMMGKIVGVALVGLTQFLLWVILTTTLYSIASATILKDIDMKQIQQKEEVIKVGADLDYMNMKKIEKPNIVTEIWNDFKSVDMKAIVLCFLFYFLGGYLMYSALFAAVGAAVDNEADTQQFMMPITIPLILSFVVAQTIIQNPESQMAFWFSIIPLTSPIVMMVRLPFGVPGWELALSMGLLVLGFIFTTWLAGRIYRTGILMYGKKVTWKELGKWLFYKG
ncbi:MAG: ABC transporter permease [Bacteroidetes bacterium]|nr:ABC transporter permease [Bacteroidota bacterium]